VTVKPESASGFPVSLEITKSGYRVSFDGWHEDFSDEKEALNCFSFGLSRECRLRVVSHGRFRHKWTVEGLRDGLWREDSTTVLLLFPFFLRKKVQVLQNALIKAV